MAEPILLLTPESSRDRNGAVALSPVNMTTVAGQYGQAWAQAGSGEGQLWPEHSWPDARVGTMIARVNTPSYGTGWLYGHNDSWANQIYARAGGGTAHGYLEYWPYTGNVPDVDIVNNQWVWVAMSWSMSDGIASIYTADGSSSTAIDPAMGTASSWSDVQVRTYMNGDFEMESFVLFDEALPPERIASIAGIPATWTWENVQLLRRFWSHVQIIE